MLSDWIVDLAEHNGYFVQATSVPGVAQRTGSTIYYLEMFPASGREPVFALMPVPGEVDIVIASELMEAGRAVQRGLVTPDRTTLIASTNRVYSMIERTAPADGRVDSAPIIEACQRSAKHFVRADYSAIANDAGSVISAALFGALASTGALPFTLEQFEATIRRGGVGVESSLEAFTAAQKPPGPAATQPDADIVELGKQRLIDYQDAQYADEYLKLLEPFDGPLRIEVARHLALWMSYEDAIRVADLKIRRARFDRVRRETRVLPEQVLKIHDFVYPRVGEIADILPASIGRWLLKTGWARGLVERFTRHGRVIETTSISGYLRLYMIASLRRWRRGSLRFEREHTRIREWLELVAELARENYDLALEAAQWPAVLKGYGETHAQGVQKFNELMSALATKH